MTDFTQSGARAPKDVSARDARSDDAPTAQGSGRVADLVADHVIPRLLVSCREAANAPAPGATFVSSTCR